MNFRYFFYLETYFLTTINCKPISIRFDKSEVSNGQFPCLKIKRGFQALHCLSVMMAEALVGGCGGSPITL